jgi:hypothetical protein
VVILVARSDRLDRSLGPPRVLALEEELHVGVAETDDLPARQRSLYIRASGVGRRRWRRGGSIAFHSSSRKCASCNTANSHGRELRPFLACPRDVAAGNISEPQPGSALDEGERSPGWYKTSENVFPPHSCSTTPTSTTSSSCSIAGEKKIDFNMCRLLLSLLSLPLLLLLLLMYYVHTFTTTKTTTTKDSCCNLSCRRRPSPNQPLVPCQVV